MRKSFQTISRSFGLINKTCCSVNGVDVSAQQSHILYEIKANQKPSIQQVADLLGIDITTFSRQIQTLVKMELVVKIPSEHDKRYSHLSLTDKGELVANEIDREVNAYLERVFSEMTEFERETVQRAVSLLAEKMTKIASGSAPSKEGSSC